MIVAVVGRLDEAKTEARLKDAGYRLLDRVPHTMTVVLVFDK